MKDRSRQITWALTVEGIPARWADGTPTKGAMWYFGEDPGSILAGYDGFEELDGESLPTAFTQRFDFDEGTAELDRITPRITATPDNLKLFWDRTGQGGLLGTAMSAATALTSEVITVTDPRATFEVGGFIYISNETLRVTAASLSAGVWTLTVTRGFADTVAAPHSVGDRVYVSVPFFERRLMRLHRIDRVAETSTVVSVCLVENIRTNPQQTLIQLSSLDIGTALAETRGFPRQNRINIEAGQLRYEADGKISGRITADANRNWSGFPFVNPNQARIWVRVGDVVARLDEEDGDYVFNALTRYMSLHEEGPGPVPTDVECRELLVATGRINFGSTSFAGVYGGQRNLISIALALMLSQNGDGSNDPEDPDNPGSFLDFDILGPNVGLGIPAAAIDMASWKREIDLGDAIISGDLIRGDEPFSFADTIARKIMLVMRRVIVPGADGQLGLRSLRPFSIDDMNELMTAGHWTWPRPNTTTLNQRSTDNTPRVGARVGETPVDDDPDVVTETIIEEDRRDASNLSQEPRFYDLEFQAKSGADQDAFRREVLDFLRQLARRKQTLGPELSLEAPFAHNHPFPGLSMPFEWRDLPGPAQWLRLVTEPPHQLMGPDGERAYPQDSIAAFVGRVAELAYNRQTGNVTVRLEMENWKTNDVLPRLIAPGSEVATHDLGTPAVLTATVDLPDLEGGVGFTAGDEVWLIQRDGKRHFRDPGLLVVTAVNDSTREITLDQAIPGLGATGEGAYLALADPDDYDNSTWPVGDSQWFPASFARRLYAFVAGDDGEIGTTLQDPPDMWSDPGGFNSVDTDATLFDELQGLHTQIVGGDRPVSTHALKALRSEIDNLMSKLWQPASSSYLGTYGTNPTQFRGNRPWVSVGGFRCCFIIPFYKNPRLTRVEFGRYLRVSNSLLDENPAEGPQIAIRVRARLFGEVGGFTADVTPKVVSSQNNWFWLDMSFDLEAPRGPSGWDWLMLEIQSTTERITGETEDPNWYDGGSLVDGRNAAEIDANTAGYFGLSPSSNGPDVETNEISATFLTDNDAIASSRVASVIQGITYALQGDRARVWPPAKANASAADVARVYRGAASYVQMGGVVAGEHFDNTFSEGQPGTPDNDLVAYQETRARVARNMASDISEIITRRQLLGYGPMAWRPLGERGVAGDELWTDRGYAHPWPTAIGDNGATTVIDRIFTCWNAFASRFTLRLLLSGLYNTSGQYSEDESYDETAEKSVDGHVTYRVSIYQAEDDDGAAPVLVYSSGDIIRQIRYVFTNAGLVAAHHLVSQFCSFDTSVYGEGLCHDEGLLYLPRPLDERPPRSSEPPRIFPADFGVLTLPGNVVDLELVETGVNAGIPFRVKVEVEVSTGPSGELAAFRDDDAKTLVPRGPSFSPGGGEQVTPARQAVKLLAWSLYTGTE